PWWGLRTPGIRRSGPALHPGVWLESRKHLASRGPARNPGRYRIDGVHPAGSHAGVLARNIPLSGSDGANLPGASGWRDVGDLSDCRCDWPVRSDGTPAQDDPIDRALSWTTARHRVFLGSQTTLVFG